MYCKWCGTENRDDSKYCFECGKKMRSYKKKKGWIKIAIPILLVVLGIIGALVVIFCMDNSKKEAASPSSKWHNEVNVDSYEEDKNEEDCISKIEKLAKKYDWKEISSSENKDVINEQLAGSWYDTDSVRYEFDANYFTGVQFDIVKMYKNKEGYFFIISHVNDHPEDLYAYQTFNDGSGMCMQDVKSYYETDEIISYYLTEIYDNPMLLGYQMIPGSDSNTEDETYGNQSNELDGRTPVSKETAYSFAQNELKNYIYENMGYFDAIAAAMSVVFQFDNVNDIIYDCYNENDGSYIHYLGFYVVLDEYGMGLNTQKQFCELLVYDDGYGNLKCIIK